MKKETHVAIYTQIPETSELSKKNEKNEPPETPEKNITKTHKSPSQSQNTTVLQT